MANLSLRLLGACCALALLMPYAAAQEAETADLRYKVVKEWNDRLANEDWESIGDEISIPHRDASGFLVQNTPNTLSIDTDGNGNPDKDIKGLRVAWSPDYGYGAVDPEVLDVTSKAAQVFEEMNVNFIPRNWLEIVAVRP